MMRRTMAVSFLAAGVLIGCDNNLFDRDEDVMDDLRADVAFLKARVDQLETKLAAVTIEDSGTDFVFTGVNVHVRNGLGATDGDDGSSGPQVNGLGNLLVGYDEGNPSNKTGSHNMVVGTGHTYTSYGGLVTAYGNRVMGPHATVTGGNGNTASEMCASVSGGQLNTASGYCASVNGGSQNAASAYGASVNGGQLNDASAPVASVSGGESNAAIAQSASVSGGRDNTASGTCTSVTGGDTNTANGSYASISGGRNNTADWLGSHVCGGNGNSTTADDEVVP